MGRRLDSVTGFRVPGVYAHAIEHERRRVSAPDPRLLIAASAAERQRLKTAAAAAPMPSVLLDALEAGYPVVVDKAHVDIGALRKADSPPPWCFDPELKYFRLTRDDSVAPYWGQPLRARGWPVE